MGGDFGKMKLTVKTDGTNDETDKDFLIYLQQMAKQVKIVDSDDEKLLEV